MKKLTITMNLADIEKVYSALKATQDRQQAVLPKIGRRSASSFFLKQASYDDSGDSKPIRTKRRVLHVAGDFTSDPAALYGATLLKEDLQYGSQEYSVLRILLNNLVREYIPTSDISLSEMNKCKTVSECVSLVNKKTTAS